MQITKGKTLLPPLLATPLKLTTLPIEETTKANATGKGNEPSDWVWEWEWRWKWRWWWRGLAVCHKDAGLIMLTFYSDIGRGLRRCYN